MALWRFTLPLLALALLLTACEKPGASHVTSPSARSLLGTTTGAVAFDLSAAPPLPTPTQPPGWEFVLENVRFARLEDGSHAIQVVTTVESDPGLIMDVWITDSTTTLARWSGGLTRDYIGTVCFQLRLERDDRLLQFPGDSPIMTIAFRDPATGESPVVQSLPIAGTIPRGGQPPTGDTDILQQLLGCPRSVI